MRIIHPASVAVAAVAVTALAGVWIAQLPAPVPAIPVAKLPVETVVPGMPWDRAHRAQLLAITSRADALALGGQLRSACDEYQLVSDLVANNDVTDPVTAGLVTSAKEHRDRLQEMIQSQIKPTVVVAVTQAPAAAVKNVPVVTLTAPAQVPSPAPVVVPVPPKKPLFETLADGARSKVSSPTAVPTKTDIATRATRSDSDLDSGSDLPSTPTQSDQHQNYAYGQPSYLAAKPSYPAPAAKGGQRSWWSVWVNGPGYVDASFTVDGHTYYLGGPGQPRRISGVGDGPGPVTVSPLPTPAPPTKPKSH